MQKIQSFHQFINREILESLSDEKELFYLFVESFYKSDLITKSERLILEKEINNPKDWLINENFFDKLKTRYDKAKEVAKELSDKAKQSLEKIVDAAKQATDFVLKIKEQLSTQITNILTNTKDKVKEKLKANTKITGLIKKKYEEDKNAFLKDLEVCKKVAQFYAGQFKDKIIDSITKSLTSFLSGEDKEAPVVERLQYLTEANMIDKLVGRLSHIPPFSWLHDVQHMGEKGASAIINGLSSVTQKLGGPKIVVPVLVSIIGIAFEYNVKGLAKQGLLDMVSFFSIPFVSPLIKFVGYVATFMAIYALIVEITQTHGEKLAGEHGDEAHGETH